MSKPDGALLILGIGNLLLRDESVGVHVVRALAAQAARSPGTLPSGTHIVEGGTLGLELLPLIDDARAVLLVDAAYLGQSPGSISVLRGADLDLALGMHLSPHQIATSDLVAVARLNGALPEAVALVGIQPAAVEVGLELSRPVSEAIAQATAMARQEAWNLEHAQRELTHA
jgi:hydrogenase maturation protease